MVGNNVYKFKKIIIYIFLISVIFTIQGMGLDDYALFSEHKEKSSITNQVIEVSDHLQTVHAEKSNSAFELIREYKNNKRSGYFNKRNIILLVILTFLLGCFHTFLVSHGLYRVRFNSFKAFIIAYIHDLDGRKRLSRS
ncbi:MAG: hypothetical protein IJ141_05225 [Lachnospiraceae bacterium]|nr:hypothetical protein [Lachnospiraceae bacterium]MBQ9199560.1 hypothetical protein [Lachnospiraceae bacterium]